MMEEPLLGSRQGQYLERNERIAVPIDAIFPELAASLCSRYASYVSVPDPGGNAGCNLIQVPGLGPIDEGEICLEVGEDSNGLNVNSMADTDVGTKSSEPTRKLGKRSRTAPALLSMHRLIQKGKAPKLEYYPSIVFQASTGLLVYLLIGVVMYIWKRDEFSGHSTFVLIDALYFCIVTMCTIGYGDITPLTPSAKMFSCLFVLVGFGFIDFLLSGMVAYALDRQELLLISAVDTRAKTYLVNSERGRMRTRTKVALALGVVLASVGAGTLVMHHQESLGWVDSFYLACMSVTTVGYGDHAFKSTHGRLFAAIWLLVSTIAVARAFLFLAEAHIDRRHRLIAKWVLERKLTVGDLVAADLNNDGFISKSEYVIYKLKEMGKIKEKDVLAICNQFNQLQCGNSGKITLSRILEDE